MPDQKKIDPFKPQQPSIPGVLPSEAKAKPEAPPPPEYPGTPQQKAPANIKLIVIAAVGALIVLAGLVYWSRKSSPGPPATTTNGAGSPATTPADAPKPAPS